jgi:hypothetical protein
MVTSLVNLDSFLGCPMARLREEMLSWAAFGQNGTKRNRGFSWLRYNSETVGNVGCGPRYKSKVFFETFQRCPFGGVAFVPSLVVLDADGNKHWKGAVDSMRAL